VTVKSPTVQMMEYQNGLRLAYVLSALAELGVADHVVDGPLPVEEIAERTGAHAPSLYRAMRAAASKGVFTEVAPRVFGLTELAATLRSTVEGSLRDVFRMQGQPFIREVYADIGHSIRTGEPAFEHVHGTDLFTYLSTRPEKSKLFSDAMGNAIRHVQRAALDAYDLSGVRHLVDIGGAHGQLMAAILRRYPSITGVVFDLPEVVRGAAEVLEEAGVADRAELVSGDYFTAVPAGGDAYVLSHVVHQLSDTDAIRVLRNIRDVMAPRGRVILVDPVLPEGDTPHAGKFMDITMMALTRGRDRTEREIVDVLANAGLRHVDTIGSAAPSSVVVAVAA
jgi:SAM-dependent methyltransferase